MGLVAISFPIAGDIVCHVRNIFIIYIIYIFLHGSSVAKISEIIEHLSYNVCLQKQT